MTAHGIDWSAAYAFALTTFCIGLALGRVFKNAALKWEATLWETRFNEARDAYYNAIGVQDAGKRERA